MTSPQTPKEALQRATDRVAAQRQAAKELSQGIADARAKAVGEQGIENPEPPR